MNKKTIGAICIGGIACTSFVSTAISGYKYYKAKREYVKSLEETNKMLLNHHEWYQSTLLKLLGEEES